MAQVTAAAHWFRKGLRLHDNPALLEACRRSTARVFPVFVLDPWFAQPAFVGVNRYAFLLECLADLDSSLRKLGTRLYVLRGRPEDVLPCFCREHGVELLTFEKDTEPYALRRDAAVTAALTQAASGRSDGDGGSSSGDNGDSVVDVTTHSTHTLHDLDAYVGRLRGEPPPTTYRAFQKLFDGGVPVRQPVAAPTADDMPGSSSNNNNGGSSDVNSGRGSGGAGGTGPGRDADGGNGGGGGGGGGGDPLLTDPAFDVPALGDVAAFAAGAVPSRKFPGGETEALARLHRTVEQRLAWVVAFEKPRTSPNSLEPATTVLSPYLKFGCLSPARFWHVLEALEARADARASAPPPASPWAAAKSGGGSSSSGAGAVGAKTKKRGKSPSQQSRTPQKTKQKGGSGGGGGGGGGGARGCTQPPVSLRGQLLWREFFYFHSTVVPHFDRMEGNPACRQIPWGRDPALVAAWEEGRTGYPFVDAIMTQLRTEGWVHHLARHMVACFLTRGDLWQHWEEGQRVFDRLLLDADWALNAGNWQWLSCSNFFYQYFRVYSPVAFGRKTDPKGDYIRKYLPVLRRLPAAFIYEPWKAPVAVQRAAGCVVGKDYPTRVVVHDDAVRVNKARMKEAYARHHQRRAKVSRSGGSVDGSGSGDGGGGADGTGGGSIGSAAGEAATAPPQKKPRS